MTFYGVLLLSFSRLTENGAPKEENNGSVRLAQEKEKQI